MDSLSDYLCENNDFSVTLALQYSVIMYVISSVYYTLSLEIYADKFLLDILHTSWEICSHYKRMRFNYVW